jgi:hypothetical protein
MRFTATKVFSLRVIGDIRFRFKNRKYRGDQKDTYIIKPNKSGQGILISANS